MSSYFLMYFGWIDFCDAAGVEKKRETAVPGGEARLPTLNAQTRSRFSHGCCYADLEEACCSGIVQRNASARSRNTRIPYSPCASRIILNMLAKPDCSSVATSTARRE